MLRCERIAQLLTVLQLKSIHQRLHSSPTPFFLIKSDGDKAEVGPLDKYEEFFANVPPLSVRGLQGAQTLQS